MASTSARTSRPAGRRGTSTRSSSTPTASSPAPTSWCSAWSAPGSPPRSRPCSTAWSACSAPTASPAGAPSSTPRASTGRSPTRSACTRLALFPGGRTRLNPLDAGPYVDSIDELRARRTQMIAALAASMLHRDLTATEEAALGWVIDIVTDAEGRRRTRHCATSSTCSPTRPTRWSPDRPRTPTATSPARSPTSATASASSSTAHSEACSTAPPPCSLDWSGRGVVIDLSAVHQDPDALTVVMIAATGWLQALLAAPESENVPATDPGARGDLGAARLRASGEVLPVVPEARPGLRRRQHLGRPPHLRPPSPDRRRHLGSQGLDGPARRHPDPDPVPPVVRPGPRSDEPARPHRRRGRGSCPELARGRALWRVGDHTAIVQHRIGSHEWPICDTDGRLTV